MAHKLISPYDPYARYTMACGTRVAVVKAFQQRQTRAYWLHSPHVDADVLREEWGHISWFVEDANGWHDNYALCREDELGEDRNEWGEICP